MKVYALSGKSGTGKSYKAMSLCKQLNIRAIVDDGLYICDNVLVAGISAKKQPTKIGAVKTALLSDPEHRKQIIECIRKDPPDKILIIGTSDKMVRIIAERLELPEISEIIHIEDITTESEREIAYRQRYLQGKHVIPVPTFQLRKEFSGYFMHPLSVIKNWGARKMQDTSERSVVRPTYSYRGNYTISEKVISDIARFTADEIDGIDAVTRVTVENFEDGINLTLNISMKKSRNIIQNAVSLQNLAFEKIEEMTAFNINRIDINVKEILETGVTTRG